MSELCGVRQRTAGGFVSEGRAAPMRCKLVKPGLATPNYFEIHEYQKHGRVTKIEGSPGCALKLNNGSERR